MYKILGGDGREYGPVTAETLRQWINEGRANALTQIKPEGATAWQALSSLPELADIFGAPPAGSPPSIGAFSTDPAAATGVHDGDYELDIGGCIGRSFEVFKANMGPMLLATLIYFGVIFALGLFGAIPFIGLLFSLASWIIGGPLLGGFYHVVLQAARRRPVNPGEVFIGFSERFGQLFLGQIVPGLLVAACMVPIAVVFFIGAFPALQSQQEPSTGAVIATGVAALILMPVIIWLSMNWLFTLLLIVDKRLDFWTAMKTSWRQVMRHWWTLFGLSIVVGLISMAGLLACCVGLLFTLPIAIGAIVQAYETMFTPRAAQPGQGA